MSRFVEDGYPDVGCLRSIFVVGRRRGNAVAPSRIGDDLTAERLFVTEADGEGSHAGPGHGEPVGVPDRPDYGVAPRAL